MFIVDGEETSSSLGDDDPNMYVLEDWLAFRLPQNVILVKTMRKMLIVNIIFSFPGV